METTYSVNNVHFAALHTALLEVGSGYAGMTATQGIAGATGGSFRVNMSDTATPSDASAVTALVAAHDPVFLSVDKTSIPADGATAATVTVTAPKSGAAPVVLSVQFGDEPAFDWPITLSGGVGSDTLASQDAGLFTITVKNGGNRSSDSLFIKAV